MQIITTPTDLFNNGTNPSSVLPGEILDKYIERYAMMQKKVEVDARASARFPFVKQVGVRPVDAAAQPLGEVFRAFTKDVSAGGLCLYSSRHITSSFLAVDLTPTVVLLRILRRRPIGMFYEVAGSFVAKLIPPGSANSDSDCGEAEHEFVGNIEASAPQVGVASGEESAP